MEKRFENIDKKTQGLIKDGGLHKPSDNFVVNVIEAVSTLEIKQEVFKPLISKKGWMLLILFSIAIIIILTIFPNNDYSFLSSYEFFQKPIFNISIPELKLSKEMIYGIGFLGMFLLQIPFLKRQFDKRTI